MKIPETLLIVEDDELFNSLLQKTLQRAGFRTEGVRNGKEAITRIQSKKSNFWLMLLDFSLPDMNGKQVINALIENQQNIPFIVITGHGSENIAVEMMKIGAVDYLLKDAGLLNLLPSVIHQTHHDLSCSGKLAKTPI